MIAAIFSVLLAAAPPAQSAADTFCLTATIYGEARGESEIGQALVAKTALNRVADPRWPDSVCGVVMDHRQFAGYGAAWPTKPQDVLAWERAEEIATAVLSGDFRPGSCGAATHFHEASIRPGWSTRIKRLCRVDNHVFYIEERKR